MSATAGPGTAGTWVVGSFPSVPEAGYAPGDVFIIPGVTPTVGVLCQGNGGTQSIVQVYPAVIPNDNMPQGFTFAVTQGAPASAICNVGGTITNATGIPLAFTMVQVAISTPGGLLSATPTIGTVVELNELSAVGALLTIQTDAGGGFSIDVQAGAPGVAGWTMWCGPYVATSDSTAFP